MTRRDPWTYIGVFAFFALLFVALFGERIAPHEAIFFVPEHGRDPRPYDPGLVFLFGSDILGRDLLSWFWPALAPHSRSSSSEVPRASLPASPLR